MHKAQSVPKILKYTDIDFQMKMTWKNILNIVTLNIEQKREGIISRSQKKVQDKEKRIMQELDNEHRRL